MEQINNDNTIKASSATLGHQVENTPLLDTSKISLVSDVNPSHNRFCDVAVAATLTNGTSQTIYTTPTDKDFYLTSANCSVIKDVTSTSTDTTIVVTIGGSTTAVLRIAGITLTAQSGSMSQTFNTPIKIDRGTGISLQNTTNVANINAKGCITGFTVDGKY